MWKGLLHFLRSHICCLVLMSSTTAKCWIFYHLVVLQLSLLCMGIVKFVWMFYTTVFMLIFMLHAHMLWTQAVRSAKLDFILSICSGWRDCWVLSNHYGWSGERRRLRNESFIVHFLFSAIGGRVIPILHKQNLLA